LSVPVRQVQLFDKHKLRGKVSLPVCLVFRVLFPKVVDAIISNYDFNNWKPQDREKGIDDTGLQRKVESVDLRRKASGPAFLFTNPGASRRACHAWSRWTRPALIECGEGARFVRAFHLTPWLVKVGYSPLAQSAPQVGHPCSWGNSPHAPRSPLFWPKWRVAISVLQLGPRRKHPQTGINGRGLRLYFQVTTALCVPR